MHCSFAKQPNRISLIFSGGIGIVQRPDYYVVPFIKSGEWMPLLEQNREADEGIWAFYPDKRHLLPKVRLFPDYLTEELN
jgi:DNA-binding transcriptional LysR family regulator